jgi:hypothetical protein
MSYQRIRRQVLRALMVPYVIFLEKPLTGLDEPPIYLPPKSRDWEKRQYRKGKRP